MGNKQPYNKFQFKNTDQLLHIIQYDTTHSTYVNSTAIKNNCSPDMHTQAQQKKDQKGNFTDLNGKLQVFAGAQNGLKFNL